MSPSSDEDPLGLRPLTARSVVLSTLLGSHPPQLPARALVAAGALFGIADGTVRVALSRLAAEGDVVASAGSYRLSDRLLDRQRRQDEGTRPPLRAWAGDWELAVLRATERGSPGSPAPRLIAAARLGRLREGVWGRPANLARPWPPALAEACDAFTAVPAGDPAALAARLWDLEGWSARADALLTALDARSDPARSFVVSAAVLQHLERDPVLPEPLLPPGWPGARLRGAYREVAGELGRLLGAPSRAPEARARHKAR